MPRPRRFELELHRQLAIAPHTPADLGRRLALHEAASPGGEEAVAAELMELGQDRHDRVVRGLKGEIIEVTSGGVGQGRRSPPDFEPSFAEKQGV